MKNRNSKVTHIAPAGPDHQVVRVVSDPAEKAYCTSPCQNCPWRKDAVGLFPPEAFRVSAPTAYDMAQSTFGCHTAGTVSPKTCAGFLLRGAAHNLNIRIGYINGRIGRDVSDGGHKLHESYRAMAVANGVDPADPVLEPCRD